MKTRKNGMPIVCDHCGGPIIKGHELVLNDRKWATIVGKSRSPYEPKYTLLCPECIEQINGGPLILKDLLRVWHKGLRKSDEKFVGAVPINLWYMRKLHMMEEAKPYIIKHIEYCGPAAKRVWLAEGLREEEVL